MRLDPVVRVVLRLLRECVRYPRGDASRGYQLGQVPYLVINVLSGVVDDIAAGGVVRHHDLRDLAALVESEQGSIPVLVRCRDHHAVKVVGFTGSESCGIRGARQAVIQVVGFPGYPAKRVGDSHPVSGAVVSDSGGVTGRVGNGRELVDRIVSVGGREAGRRAGNVPVRLCH